MKKLNAYFMISLLFFSMFPISVNADATGYTTYTLTNQSGNWSTSFTSTDVSSVEAVITNWDIGVVNATGGTITTDGDYNIHTFLSNGTFTPDSTYTIEVLIVGGGGAGRGMDATYNSGDGGNAGDYYTNASISIGQCAYSVTVGAGGTGVVGDAGNTGGDSVFNFITSSGGTGGQSGSSSTARDGGDGAGEVGGIGSGSQAGAGGTGLANSITGTSIYYAGGGGGGFSLGGLGGNGGGGRGEDYNALNATVGTANTGGGGGGLSRSYTTHGANAGEDGGSGIVIIRYNTSQGEGTTNFTLESNSITNTTEIGTGNTSTLTVSPTTANSIYINTTSTDWGATVTKYWTEDITLIDSTAPTNEELYTKIQNLYLFVFLCTVFLFATVMKRKRE